MSIRGRWQVVETPGYDMALASAYILLDEAGGEFAFDCLAGSIHGACYDDTVEFGWQGNDEMEPAEGDGWAELKDDGSLEGEICLLNGDNIPFIARRSKTSSTACSSSNILTRKHTLMDLRWLVSWRGGRRLRRPVAKLRRRREALQLGSVWR
ncbi:hypothetical protein PMN64_31900 [Bradyrhizobium sp. UFLA01-814]|uniref:hypothetical protein n=1 Tax=Bradyrhizobium sp. UFLA01-814 TaxID=3023480 RepID=UPI00398A81EC